MDKLNKCNFSVVRCVESGNGFAEGEYYAQVGSNNGVQILRKNGQDDCEVFWACTGGTGKGLYNNFNDSGKPSFVPVFPNAYPGVTGRDDIVEFQAEVYIETMRNFVDGGMLNDEE